MKIKQTAGYSLPALVALGLTSSVSGQLYWDPLGNNHWDLISENWDNNAATDNFVVWDNTGSQEAIFESNGLAEIADGGVTVGDLSTTVSLTLQSFTDNLGLITIKPGGATWNTGGLDIHFINNQLNDTPLSISSGDTLTVSGGGTFDTGEKPNGANWTAAGAILDFTEATFIRGNPGSVGQFDTVRLPGGSSYIHERNSGQTYSNNWELGAGVVRFSNRWNRQHEHDGLVSGEGTLQVDAMGGQYVRLKNAANSFSGGVIIDSTANRSELLVIGDEGVLGAVPESFDPDNIILRGGGELKLNGVTVNPNRGITLDEGGMIVNSGAPNTYGGTITGTGGLQIGRAQGGDANALILTSDTNDYTGGTQVFRGRLALGIDEALPDNTVLTVGGAGSSLFILNGYTQTLTGLEAAASNTRQIINYNGVGSPDPATLEAGTVILDITDEAEVDEEYFFGSAFGVDETTDAGKLNIVKNGEGAIGLGNVRVAGTVDVNSGTLRIGNSVGFSSVGALTNNASLVIDEELNAESLAMNSGSDTRFNWELSDWTGIPGTGFSRLTVAGTLNLASGSPLTIAVEENELANFAEENVSFVVATTSDLTADAADITVDASGFTSGNGTWAARIEGNDIYLDYTAGTASDAYSAWASGFAGLTGGFDDDDDNDGVANGLEFYFFNSDPTAPESLPSPLTVVSSTGGGNLVFSHDRPVDSSGLSAAYEWSTTLDGDWTASGSDNGGTTVTITPGTPAAAAAGYENVVVTVSSTPATLDKVFVRLAVNQP
ncbi:hypothetical protein AAFN60_20415 [Roseibacillus persicicus]|uniref:hypothetical protein n=1 Tax=Roseibacillus persicicus TaxID=454148 RepID=UPI00398B1FCB